MTRSSRVKDTTLSVERCAFVGDDDDDILFEIGTQGRLQNCTLSADLCTSIKVLNYVDNVNCTPNRSLPVVVDELSRASPRLPSLGVPLSADESFPPLAAAPDVFAGANDTAVAAIQQVQCCRFYLLGLCSCSKSLQMRMHLGCHLQCHLTPSRLDATRGHKREMAHALECALNCNAAQHALTRLQLRHMLGLVLSLKTQRERASASLLQCSCSAAQEGMVHVCKGTLLRLAQAVLLQSDPLCAGGHSRRGRRNGLARVR